MPDGTCGATPYSIESRCPVRKKSDSRLRRLLFTFIVVSPGLLSSDLNHQILGQHPTHFTPANELLTLLRRSCFDEKELWGVHVRSLDLHEGAISLQVLLDHEQQREPLEETVRHILSDLPTLQQWQSADVRIEPLAVLALRSSLLAKLQSMMATNALTDTGTRSLLRRTRLDNARFDYDGGIAFEATTIDEQALIESTLNEKPADCAEHRLIIELEEFLSNLLPADAFDKWRLFNNKVHLRALKSPVREMTTGAVANEALDGIELKDAYYDESGKLRITGSVQSIDQRAKLFQFLRPFFEASAVCRSQQEAQEAIDHLEQSPFGLYVAMLRQRFWESDSPIAQSTWLRRAYFVTHGQVAVEAETFAPEIASGGDEANAILLTLMQSAHAGVADQNLRQMVAGFRHLSIKTVPSPARIVQQAIARRSEMDGSQVDAVSFDANGQLDFHGQCDGIAQEADLRLLVAESLRAERHPWAGVAFDLTVSHEPTRELLTTLRRAASTWNEVRIDRLWFADDGHLKVKGEATEGQTTAEIVRLFRELAMKQLREPRIKQLAEDIELDIATRRPSMLKVLRTQISEDKSLEGVCLARGYYDEDARFVMEVVLERAEQTDSIRALMAATAEAEAWSANVPNGWTADFRQIQPLAPLISCLRTAVPAYEELDGIHITSAFHDAEHRLSFRGTIFCNAIDAEARLRQATKKLESLLANHSEWKPRVSIGISLVDLQIRPPNRDVARLSIARSLQELVGRNFKSAVDHLDIALLNDPADSTSWFLRGLCYRSLLLKSKESERDFFRAALIEGKRENARQSRIVRIERIQGSTRNDAEGAINAYRAQIGARVQLEYVLGIGQCAK